MTMTKTIPLTQGLNAVVDDEDFEALNRFRWHANAHGYAARMARRNGKRIVILMHWHVCWSPPGTVVDHINGNRLDNRRSNLRACTRAQNNTNRRMSRQGRSSQFRGVCWRTHAKAWKAYIKHERKQMHLGYFKDERAAAQAYNDAALRLFGEFALLNDLGAQP